MDLACKIVVEVIESGIRSADDIKSKYWMEIAQRHLQPRLGVCLGVMQCARGKGVSDVPLRLGDRVLFVETKYDGERLQIHVDRSKNLCQPEIKIFSKSGRDSTLPRQGCHAQILSSLKDHVESIILDGELLVFNEDLGSIEPFGTVQSVSREILVHSNLPRRRHLFVIFFDIIYLNGKSLAGMPLNERKRLLDNSICPIQNYVEIAPYEVIDNREKATETLTHLFSQAMALKLEGLIIKNADSKYLPHSRRDWIKLKADYIDGFHDTLDFCVVGVRRSTSTIFIFPLLIFR